MRADHDLNGRLMMGPMSGSAMLSRRAWLARLFVPILLGAVTLLFFRGVVFDPYAFFPWDDVDQCSGLRNFLVRCLRAWQLPLWNPYLLCGYPAVGDPAASPFYPSVWLDALSPWGGNLKWLCWEVVGHVFLASIFTYLVLRRLGAGKASSLIGAILFSFAGYMPHYPSREMNLRSLAWLPAIGYAALALWQTRKWRYLMLGAIFTCLSWLGGHTQIAFYNLLFLSTAWFLLAVFSGEDSVRDRFAGLGWCVLMILCGTALAAISLLPSMDAVSHSARSTYSLSESFIGTDRHALINLFLPNIFGPARPEGSLDNYLGYEIASDQTYLGWLIILAPLALFMGSGRQRLQGRIHVLFLILTAILALGVQTRLYPLFHQWVPFDDKFRRADTFWAMTSWFSAISVGLAVHHVLERRSEKLLKILTGIVLVLTLGYGMMSLFPQSFTWILGKKYLMGMEVTRYVLSEHIFSSAWTMALLGSLLTIILLVLRPVKYQRFLGLALVAFCVLDVVINNSGWVHNHAVASNRVFKARDMVSLDKIYNGPLSFPEVTGVPLHGSSPQWRTLALSGYAWQNGGAALGMKGVMGYVNVIPGRYADFIACATDLTHPSIDLLGIRYILSGPEPAGIRQPRISWERRRYKMKHGRCFPHFTNQSLPDKFTLYKPEESNGLWFRVYENPSVLPIFQITSSYRVVSSATERISIISSPDFDPAVVLLESPPAEVLSGTGTVDLVDYRLNSIRLKAFSTGPALLYMTENHDPWWKATVNGERAEILVANHSFRAVVIPTGGSEVVLTYSSRPFHTGAAVTGATFVLLILFLIISRTLKPGTNPDGSCKAGA